MSEEVSQFLLQIKELGDRRVEEDAARSRELEEQILQEKRERQARRAGTFLLAQYLPIRLFCSKAHRLRWRISWSRRFRGLPF